MAHTRSTLLRIIVVVLKRVTHVLIAVSLTLPQVTGLAQAAGGDSALRVSLPQRPAGKLARELGSVPPRAPGAVQAASTTPSAHETVADTLRNSPVMFIENVGQ